MDIQNDLRDLLIRVDERTLSIESRLNELSASNNSRVTKIEETLENRYVTRDEFKPVRMIAFAIVGVTALAVLSAVIGLVITKAL